MIACGQNEMEFQRLCAIAKAEGVTRYLEIGCRYGGSFDRMVRTLPKDGRFVAIDLPGGPWGKKSAPSLKRAVAQLAADGWTDTRAIFGDSHAADTRDMVRRCGPFDLIFIDADHTYEAVAQDWADYGPLARLVAFHDINGEGQKAKKIDYPVEVPRLWGELRGRYRHEEIIDPADKYGIGVLWT